MLKNLFRATRAAVNAPSSNGYATLIAEIEATKRLAESSIMFDPNDGKKRVVIAVNEEGGFEPPQWYGMRAVDDDNGLHEAAIIAAHGSLIFAEVTCRYAVRKGQPDGE